MPYDLHQDLRSSQQRIAARLRRKKRGPVLDVGAGSGGLGRLLRGSGIAIDAIEPDATAAASAGASYRTVRVSTIEDADLPPSHYGVVVCADILEHTADPEAVLRRLMDAAEPDAEFLISLPNVAHLAARLIILSGRFPAHDRGIFDRTHLHYFTHDTAVELLKAVGLRPTMISATPIPLEHVWPGWLGRSLFEAAMQAQMMLGRVAPRLFAFQWLIVAQR